MSFKAGRGRFLMREADLFIAVAVFWLIALIMAPLLPRLIVLGMIR